MRGVLGLEGGTSPDESDATKICYHTEDRRSFHPDVWRSLKTPVACPLVFGHNWNSKHYLLAGHAVVHLHQIIYSQVYSIRDNLNSSDYNFGKGHKKRLLPRVFVEKSKLWQVGSASNSQMFSIYLPLQPDVQHLSASTARCSASICLYSQMFSIYLPLQPDVQHLSASTAKRTLLKSVSMILSYNNDHH